LLQLEKCRVIDVDRENLSGWPEKTRQWNRVEALSASDIRCCVSGSELEGFDDTTFHFGDTIVFRLRLRRLAKQTADD